MMLVKIGVLTAAEGDTLKKALAEIGALWREGKFKVERSQEDGHTAIEQYITEKYGEVGKKIHTGRSRNDQSLTMIRLFALDRLREVRRLAAQLAAAAEAKAKALADVPMPGYTHMQRAMPTTVGKWLGAFASGWRDVEPLAAAALTVLDQSPLGSAAGFGINGLELDRAASAEAMGFARVQENPMYCGLSRGMFENLALQAMSFAVVLCSRFATDMMMFTQQESAFLKLPDNFVTGSSIMPQKKNYDLFEIMRANGKVFGSLQQQIQETVVGLGSGYHRDLQCTKKAFVEACGLCTSTLELLVEAVPRLEAREANLRAAMTEDLFVTDEVYRKVAAGAPFREAYAAAKADFFKRQAAAEAEREGAAKAARTQ
uniref:Fumarate lyase N-terminal domain-containing protein n=1 Tax=Zooxanthella nutricula TaxID=1333877 RepID=A0A7S2HKH2_9DINO